jgi:hypothetical protein
MVKQISEYAVGKTDDIEYNSTSTSIHVMDLYRISNPNDIETMVVYAHGGSFINGTEENQNAIDCKDKFNAEGYNVISVRYTLQTQKSYDDAITTYMTTDDSSDILNWSVTAVVSAANDLIDAIDHIKQMGIKKINLIGYSAGAIMSLCCALGPDSITGLKTYDRSIVQSITSIAGSLTTQLGVPYFDGLDDNSPNLMIWHGSLDDTLVVSGAQSIKNKYDDLGISSKCILNILEGVGHNDIWSIRSSNLQNSNYDGLLPLGAASLFIQSNSELKLESESETTFTNTVVFGDRNIVQFFGTVIAGHESGVDNMDKERLNLDKELPLTDGNFIQYWVTSSTEEEDKVDLYTEVAINISPSAYVLYYTDNGIKQYLKFNNENDAAGITETIEEATVLEIKTNSSGYQYFYIPKSIDIINPDPEPQPLVPICFPAETPVTTDQGNIAIELLDTDNHTIRGNKIVAITQTKTPDTHIVSIEKGALGNNVPSATTNISNEHSVFYKGKMIKARYLVRLCKNVKFIPYMGETLYNVLLDNNGTMMINNLICETLDTKNIMAKIINSDVSPSQKQTIYKQLSSNIKKDIQNQRDKQKMRKKMVYYV